LSGVIVVCTIFGFMILELCIAVDAWIVWLFCLAYVCGWCRCEQWRGLIISPKRACLA